MQLNGLPTEITTATNQIKPHSSPLLSRISATTPLLVGLLTATISTTLKRRFFSSKPHASSDTPSTKHRFLSESFQTTAHLPKKMILHRLLLSTHRSFFLLFRFFTSSFVAVGPDPFLDSFISSALTNFSSFSDSSSDSSVLNLSRLGFILTTREAWIHFITQLQSLELGCALKSGFIKPVFTFDSLHQLQTSFSTVYRVFDPSTGKWIYLSTGSRVLTTVCYVLSMCCCLLSAIWIDVLFKKRTATFSILWFMLVAVILKVLNLLCEAKDKSSCSGIKTKILLNISDAPFSKALKVLDKMAHSKLMVTYSLNLSFTTLSPINVNYGHVSDNLCTSSITALSLIISTLYNNHNNFSFNVSCIKLYDSNQTPKSFLDSYFKYTVGIPDVFISSMTNLKFILSYISTNITLIFFKTKIITIDNKFLIDTSIFIIPTSGTVATVRSSLHSFLFDINHILVHFLFDKLNFAPHKSISISRYTFTLSSLIAQLNDNRHQVTNFTRDKYSHFVTTGSFYDLEDKVDFEGVGMIGYQYGL